MENTRDLYASRTRAPSRMDISTDSLVDLEVPVNGVSGDTMDGDAGHLVASGASPNLNATTPAHGTTSDVATANVTARTATDTTTYVTMGVAAEMETCCHRVSAVTV